MQAFLNGAQLYQRADRAWTNRGPENLRKAQHGRHAHQASPLRRISCHGAQDPRPPSPTITIPNTNGYKSTYPCLYQRHFTTSGNSVILRHGCRGPTEHRDEAIPGARSRDHH